MKVDKLHLNINNHLFGGITASLIDIGGSLAIAAKYNSLETGVSTDMSISYLRSAKEGDLLQFIGLIRIESMCVKSGRNLAFTNVEVFVGDKLIAFGR